MVTKKSPYIFFMNVTRTIPNIFTSVLWGIEPAISVGSKNVAGAGGGCTVGPPNVGVGSRSFKGTEPVCCCSFIHLSRERRTGILLDFATKYCTVYH